ncbi:hypothetical protein JZU71_02840, partial [bacterium]|nr:hypothetical protein [bacterium]
MSLSGQLNNAWRSLSVVLFAVVLSLPGCGSNAASAVPPTDPTEAYLSAVLDSSMVTPSKIYQGLTPITNDNPRLIWENGVVGSRLLVSTWMG